MRRVALLVLLLGLVVAATPALAQQHAAPSSPDTQVRIALQQSGDARWTVTVRFPLASPTDTAAFDRLRAEYTSGSADYLSVQPYQEAAARVSERTDRPMAITDVNRSAGVASTNETTVGELRLQFTWTNFAQVGDDEVSVGQAFVGGWFGDLGAGQSLVVDPPPGYQVHTAEPAHSIENGSLRWAGPQTFGPGEPAMSFDPIPQGPTGPTIPFTAPVFLGIGVVIGVLLFVAYRRGWVGTVMTDGTTDARAEADEASDTEREAPSPAAGDAESEPADPEAEAEPDPELLSDEERVERLLREEGGRMRQAKIVEETRWSNAKVSQLLSAMAEEGRVEKLRLGRENLISLPEDAEEE
ncbi:MAG: helix-turn-helix transcriptional regulator [Halanaeroarchaeum sp.]